MQNKNQKPELTWIGKNERPNLKPRILIEDPEKSYGDAKSENMLICPLSRKLTGHYQVI